LPGATPVSVAPDLIGGKPVEKLAALIMTGGSPARAGAARAPPTFR
jgi:hypothetical protein